MLWGQASEKTLRILPRTPSRCPCCKNMEKMEGVFNGGCNQWIHRDLSGFINIVQQGSRPTLVKTDFHDHYTMWILKMSCITHPHLQEWHIELFYSRHSNKNNFTRAEEKKPKKPLKPSKNLSAKLSITIKINQKFAVKLLCCSAPMWRAPLSQQGWLDGARQFLI